MKRNWNSIFFAIAIFCTAEFCEAGSGQYFVIQNVATEKTRVYERCFDTPSCPHRLVMETDMIVGRPEAGTKTDRYAFTTWLGHAKISEWVKFYQDRAEHYPPWYRDGDSLASIPTPISKGISKIAASRKWLKKIDGATTVQGAFGWYAAKVTPADDKTGMNYQWMHGTIGWGVDGATPIELTRGFLMNLFTNPASAGCTRLENRAIAYLRHLLPVGTDIYRIYAMEATTPQGMAQYNDVQAKPWNYLLLSDGAQKRNGLTADESSVLASSVNIDRHNFIERGVYLPKQIPTAVGLDYSKSPSSGKSGDRYRINKSLKGKNNFKGHFLVDEGRLLNYRHPTDGRTPSTIRVSGLSDFINSVPEFLRK